MYSASVRDEAERRLAGLPHTGPYPEVGPVFRQVWETLVAAGLAARVGPGVMVAYSDPGSTPPAELQSFAGVELPEGVACPDGLEERLLAGGRHAVLEMTGPYSGLGAAWGWLYGPWMAEAGERPAMAPAFEVYRNDPTDTAPEALRTDLHAPLA